MVVDAMKVYKVPYSMAIGDQDMAYDLKSVMATEALVREKIGTPEGNDYDIHIYKGCNHGFAARAHPGNKVEHQAAEDAAKQAADWYNKYLN